MARATPIELGQALAPLPTLPYVSLLPASIAHDGPADVATYFPTRPLPSAAASTTTSSSSKPQALEAAFRGRLVVSTPLAVPAGYTGLVFTTSTPVASTSSVATPCAAKKPKVSKPKDEDKDAKPLMRAPLGARRSPRKQVVQAKYSMDSDDEDSEGDAPEGEGEPPVEPSEVEVLDDASAVVEEVATDAEDPAAAARPPLASEASLVILAETPATPPRSEESSQKDMKRDAEEAGLDEQEEQERDLARDVQVLVPTATFDTVQIWHADFALDMEEDTYARTLTEWFSIADKIHAY
ncbi:hypothetical protein RQP46_011395 [Phenoliferia psychrophenolica]